MKKRETDVEKERLRLAGLCARSEQCEYDIRTKLDRTTLSPSQKQEIITFLKENKFIDNARFAGSFTRDKINFSKWGKNKIRFHLFQKRIPSYIIASALDDIDEESYFEVALSLVKAKERQFDLKSADGISKLYRSMMTRGFSGDIIKKALNKAKTENPEE